MFKPVGIVSFDKSVDFDKLFETAVDLGADDIQEKSEDDGEEYKVLTSVKIFKK